MKVDFQRSMKFHENELLNNGYNYRAEMNYIELVIRFAQRVIKEDPTISPEELKECIYQSMDTLVYYYTKNVDCAGLIAQRELHEKVLNDNKFLFEEYSRIKNDKLETKKYVINFDEDEEVVKREYIRTMLAHLRKQKSEIPTEIISAIKQYSKMKNIPKEMRDKIRIAMPFLAENEFEQLKAFMEYNNDNAEERLKDKYIGLMIQIGDFFKGFGLLEKYRDINDIELRRIGIESLSYPISSKSDDRDTIGIEDIFKEKFLDELDLEELAILNTFWQNRFAKETKTVNGAIFYISTLNLWSDIVERKPIDISNQEMLDAVFLKSKFMEEMAKRITTNNVDDIEKVSMDNSQNRKMCYINDLVSDIDNQIGKQYKKYFDKRLPNLENDFIQDLRDTIVLYTNKENIYLCKDTTISSLLYTFMSSKKIKNWGYMTEVSKNGQKSNKLQDKRYVLIGIDYEGYNMPLRFHMKRQNLQNELMIIGGNTIIPIYEGEEDFWYKNQLVKAQVFMPLDKKHKNAIKELSDTCSESSRKYKLIKHLDFIRKSDNFPEHLKIETTDGRKTIRKRCRKYIDIKTGEVYVMDGKKYILDNKGNDSYGDDGTR